MNRSPGQMQKPMRPQPGVGHPLHGGFSMGIPFNKALHLITKTLSKANTPVVFGFLNDQLDFYMFLYLHIKVHVFTCECDVCIHDILCLYALHSQYTQFQIVAMTARLIFHTNT